MTTPEKFLFYDADLCMGCHACEVACKAEHNLPAEVNRTRVITEGPVIVTGKLELRFQRISCLHCTNPPCLEVCPVKALRKRQDGIVFVDESLCTGCRSCAEICPHGAIDFLPDNSTAQICDLCYHRLDKGQLPFCLKHCMSGALFFGTHEEFKRPKQKTQKVEE